LIERFTFNFFRCLCTTAKLGVDPGVTQLMSHCKRLILVSDMRGDTQGIEIGDAAGEAEEEIADMVLKSTFLGGVTGATLGSFLSAGRAVPVFGEVLSLFIHHHHAYVS